MEVSIPQSNWGILTNCRKALKGPGSTPPGQNHNHDCESDHLPHFDTDVEGKDTQDQVFVAEKKLLEAGG